MTVWNEFNIAWLVKCRIRIRWQNDARKTWWITGLIVCRPAFFVRQLVRGYFEGTFITKEQEQTLIFVSFEIHSALDLQGTSAWLDRQSLRSVGHLYWNCSWLCARNLRKFSEKSQSCAGWLLCECDDIGRMGCTEEVKFLMISLATVEYSTDWLRFQISFANENSVGNSSLQLHLWCE